MAEAARPTALMVKAQNTNPIMAPMKSPPKSIGFMRFSWYTCIKSASPALPATMASKSPLSVMARVPSPTILAPGIPDTIPWRSAAWFTKNTFPAW